MTANELISLFEKMYREKWAYGWGASSVGAVDCAGAFVWAMKQHGLSIYHGSNRIQRTEILEMLPIEMWEPGMAVFKRRSQGEADYALPQGYLPGGVFYNGDLSDYYHIGLVDTDGNVLNAQNQATGFVKSKLDRSWCGVAKLKKIIYEEAAKMATATVKTEDGNPVKLRADPSTKNAYIGKIAAGAAVEVLEKAVNDAGEEWAKVSTGGKIGYVMSKFLNDDSVKPQEATLSDVNRKLDEILAILKGEPK